MGVGVEVGLRVGVGVWVGVGEGVREGVSVGVGLGVGVWVGVGEGVREGASVGVGVDVEVGVGLTAPWPGVHPALNGSTKRSRIVRAPANASTRFGCNSITSGAMLRLDYSTKQKQVPGFAGDTDGLCWQEQWSHPHTGWQLPWTKRKGRPNGLQTVRNGLQLGWKDELELNVPT